MLERERFAANRCATRVSSWVLEQDSTEAWDEDCEDGDMFDSRLVSRTVGEGKGDDDMVIARKKGKR
jgi:hypothetical protein